MVVVMILLEFWGFVRKNEAMIIETSNNKIDGSNKGFESIIDFFYMRNFKLWSSMQVGVFLNFFSVGVLRELKKKKIV